MRFGGFGTFVTLTAGDEQEQTTSEREETGAGVGRAFSIRRGNTKKKKRKKKKKIYDPRPISDTRIQPPRRPSSHPSDEQTKESV
jgi:hypothetical protein